MPTLVSSEGHTFPVQVMNLSGEDVWLKSGTRLGLLTHVDRIQGDDTFEVQ